MTVGIKPTWPCPSYGYIERGERADLPGLALANPAFNVVKRFREKPDPALAEPIPRERKLHLERRHVHLVGPHRPR